MWSGLLTTIIGGVKILFGDRSARETADADDQAALRRQFAAEFTGPERVGLWNSFVDGLNRLPRPMFTFGTLGMFIWAVCDPAGFTIAMAGLSAIPEPLWIGMGTIVFFWFGGKVVEDFRAPAASARTLKELLQQIEEMKKIVHPPAPMSEDTFHREMADDSKPLSDEAIRKWNSERRH